LTPGSTFAVLTTAPTPVTPQPMVQLEGASWRIFDQK
jgi:hypothetical protein